MYPFIALAWDSDAPDAAGEAQRLLADVQTALPDYEIGLNANGLAVLVGAVTHDGTRVYHLAQNAGVILGRLFPRDPDEWHADWSWLPSAAQTAEILRTQGQWLIRRMWGSYIAFLKDPGRYDTLVLRDCSGKLPCYRMRHSSVDIFFADPADLCAVGSISLSINWDYVFSFLCMSQVQLRETALDGVTELLAGDCFLRASNGSCKQYCGWSPDAAMQEPLIDRFDAAVHAVRATAIYCVSAWASVYGTILLNLSGGLDSTVVLACLTQSRRRPTVICVNNFGMNGAEDERTYARLAASTASVTLLEVPMFAERQMLDDALEHLPLAAKPTIPGTIGTLGIALVNELAAKYGASSVWTGQGGDHLFLQTTLPVGPLDYAALRGYRLGLLTALRDAARLSRYDYWRIAAALWKENPGSAADGLNRAAGGENSFVAADVRSRASSCRLVHPWTASTQSRPPGQRLQVTALSEVLNRHRPLPGLQRVFEHHPLLSQPLIEQCLRIPSYVHLNAGVDRAVERAAFAALIPQRIANRRRKGQSTFSILEAIHRSGDYVRDLLLGGVLAREGILDRISLEPYLNDQRPVELKSLFPLLSCIAAELWTRNALNSGAKTSPCRVPSD